MQKKKVCLIGAGFISSVHGDALKKLNNVELVAVIDLNTNRAQALAKSLGVKSFASIAEANEKVEFDTAHILVPPHLHHRVAMELIELGKDILVEKPYTTDVSLAEELNSKALEQGVTVGVNQNFVFHPALLKAKQALAEKRIGEIKSIQCTYAMPLRQMDAQQFSHWMFQQPKNIFLEQAVHPLSQIKALLPEDDMRLVNVQTKMLDLVPNLPFCKSASVNLEAGNVSIGCQFTFGNEFPIWQLHINGDNGYLVVDVAKNRCVYQTYSAYLPELDLAVNGLKEGASVIGQGARVLWDYSLSMLGLGKKASVFEQSMVNTFNDFYGALSSNKAPTVDQSFATALIDICDQIEQTSFADIKPAPIAVNSDEDAEFDVLLLGGTGFIGRRTLKRLLEEGYKVAVIARNTTALPAVFNHENAFVYRGDVGSEETLRKYIPKAKYVVNLAHGGGSGSFEQIKKAMVDSALMVANICIESKTTKLVHIGSIASLYLGDSADVITAHTPTDPQAEQRADYGRAKGIADDELLKMAKQAGLDLVVLRPGVVIGQGGLVNHTGVGFFNNTQYFLGWNQGKNPLPFVLVDDVAEAINSAMTMESGDCRTYNLVGDVQISAREYVEALKEASGRPYTFKPQSTRFLYMIEYTKYLIKRAGGRKVAPPSMRDLNSRSLLAKFDTSIEKKDLNWQPVSSRSEFINQGINSNFSDKDE